MAGRNSRRRPGRRQDTEGLQVGDGLAGVTLLQGMMEFITVSHWQAWRETESALILVSSP